MKRFYFLLALPLILPILSIAQTGELLVKNDNKGLYIEHKVMPKEGLFPLGRLYNVHPRHIANFNGLDFNKGLVIGQLIKIPLTDTNFNQKSTGGVPVYYRVGEKEGLMRVSNVNNKVSLENLRSWNKLDNDNVDFGTRLIVGYLVSKEMKIIAPPVVIEEKKEDQKKQQMEYNEINEARKNNVNTIETKEPEKKQEIVTASKIETNGEGFFKWHFEQQSKKQHASKDQTVTAGIFKTTSGWNDSKYYLLIDDVQPGTIVKITNPSNSKSVYAKVLGKMEGINLNKGLDIRISNAAASNLGVTETDKFIVKVNY